MRAHLAQTRAGCSGVAETTPHGSGGPIFARAYHSYLSSSGAIGQRV